MLYSAKDIEKGRKQIMAERQRLFGQWLASSSNEVFGAELPTGVEREEWGPDETFESGEFSFAAENEKETQPNSKTLAYRAAKASRLRQLRRAQKLRSGKKSQEKDNAPDPIHNGEPLRDSKDGQREENAGATETTGVTAEIRDSDNTTQHPEERETNHGSSDRPESEPMSKSGISAAGAGQLEEHAGGSNPPSGVKVPSKAPGRHTPEGKPATKAKGTADAKDTSETTTVPSGMIRPASGHAQRADRDDGRVSMGPSVKLVREHADAAVPDSGTTSEPKANPVPRSSGVLSRSMCTSLSSKLPREQRSRRKENFGDSW